MTVSGRTTVVPGAAVLSVWQHRRWDGGVSLDRLRALDRLIVRTSRSVYEIVVSSPDSGEVLVRGGDFFPAFAPARIAGSTLGGSVLKVRSIHPGFRLEFSVGREFVLTSPVRSIEITATAVE